MHVEEKHYSPKELAIKWGFSPGTIRNLFRYETEGVLRIEGLGPVVGKRPYTTYSISESAANRVYQRLTQKLLQAKLPRRNPRSVVFLSDRNRRVA
jgi:hypothetical protein